MVKDTVSSTPFVIIIIVRKESTKEFMEIAETSHLKMVDESVSFDWNYYRVVLPIPKAEMNLPIRICSRIRLMVINSKSENMKYQTSLKVVKSFFTVFILTFISSGLSAGTLGLDGKKKDKEKKEELSADGPYVFMNRTARCAS